MSAAAPTVHATAVLLGAAGVLIRGPSSSGKTTLAQSLVADWRRTGFACLVADDRVVLSQRNDRLIASPPAELAGRMELRGRGIVSSGYEPACVVRLVVDIVEDGDLERMPEDGALTEIIDGVRLCRQPVPRDRRLATILINTALIRV